MEQNKIILCFLLQKGFAYIYLEKVCHLGLIDVLLNKPSSKSEVNKLFGGKKPMLGGFHLFVGIG